MIPNLPVTKNDLLEIIELSRPRWSDDRWRDDPFVFSASDRGIWPRTGWGTSSRTYVDGQSWLLDHLRVLATATRYNPKYGSGGMIRIRPDGAYWVLNEEPVAYFDRS